MEYWNADKQLRSALNVATSCTYMVRFGAVTPKTLLLIFVLLWKKVQKWTYVADYLRTCSTDFYQAFSFDRHVGGDD